MFVKLLAPALVSKLFIRQLLLYI